MRWKNQRIWPRYSMNGSYTIYKLYKLFLEFSSLAIVCSTHQLIYGIHNKTRRRYTLIRTLTSRKHLAYLKSQFSRRRCFVESLLYHFEYQQQYNLFYFDISNIHVSNATNIGKPHPYYSTAIILQGCMLKKFINHRIPSSCYIMKCNLCILIGRHFLR